MKELTRIQKLILEDIKQIEGIEALYLDLSMSGIGFSYWWIFFNDNRQDITYLLLDLLEVYETNFTNYTVKFRLVDTELLTKLEFKPEDNLLL